MIARLQGKVHKLSPGEVIMDVQGVGYQVATPIDVWDLLKEHEECVLWIVTYVREDRLDLFGFLTVKARSLFKALIASQGIGPKMALEICAVPDAILHRAISQQDANMLKGIKGIGQKKAEKLLLELKSLLEKKPDILDATNIDGTMPPAADQDAIAALNALGYDSMTIMKVLKDLPEDLISTEERVTAALRNL